MITVCLFVFYDAVIFMIVFVRPPRPDVLPQLHGEVGGDGGLVPVVAGEVEPQALFAVVC